MNNTKVFQYFLALRQEEHGVFVRFLQQSVPRQKYVHRLFGLLIYHKEAIHNKTVKAPDLTSFLYKNKAGKSDGQLNKSFRDTCSKLSKLMLEFFDEQELKTNPFIKAQLRASAMAGRDNPSAFQREVGGLLPKDQKQEGDANHHYLLHQLHHHLFFHPSTNLLDLSSNVFINNAIYHLDVFYCIQRLDYILEKRIRTTQFNDSKDYIADEQSILDLANAAPLKQIPLIQNYLGLHQLLKGKNESLLESIKPAIYDRLPNLSAANRYRMFTHLTNIASINKFSLAAIFQLYKDAAHYNIMALNRMNETHFLNAVFLATECLDLDWANDFVANNYRLLSPEKADLVKRYSECLIDFKRGKFLEVIGLLSGTKNYNLNFGLRKHALLVKANFESFLKHDPHSLDNELIIFLEYLRNSEDIGEKARFSNEQFIAFVRQLKKWFRQKRQPDAPEITAVFESFQPVVEIKWLEQKIQELLEL